MDLEYWKQEIRDAEILVEHAFGVTNSRFELTMMMMLIVDRLDTIAEALRAEEEEK
jgi:hypothetical protein